MRKVVRWRPVTCGVAGVVLLGVATSAWAVDPQRIMNADKDPNNWLTYHGSYKSWHYSPLDQINTDNVDQLQIAWMHTPGRSTRGLQSFPLVADGALYYSGSYSRLFALDLKASGAKERLMTTLRAADVLLEQFRPGVMERPGSAMRRSRRSTRG